MPNFIDAAVPPLDRIGFVLFGSGVALLSYVLEVFGEHSLPGTTIAFLAALSLALLAAYGWHSRQAAAPLLALGLFKIRTFRVSVLGGFATRLGIGAMPFLLPLFYQVGLGYAPWAAGLLTMPQALAALGLKIMSRPLLARFGFRKVLIVNTVLLGVTMLGFHYVEAGTPIWCILLLSFAQGCFSSLQFTSMNTLTYADVVDGAASKASSIASTAQQMSLSFGVAFGALLAAWFLGHVDQTLVANTIPALHRAFIVLGTVTLVSSATFWSLRATDGDNVSNHGVTPKLTTQPQ
jgi:Na+/melibiose symporter-like transporter